MLTCCREATPSLHSIPIYYASALAKKCLAVYQTYLNMMNKRIQHQAQFSNPFIFKHILNLRGIEQFEDSGPAVVMASPGMLQSGLARELLELWAPDPNNGVIITGYSVEGTLAKHILSEPTHIQTLTGQKLPLNLSVAYISFSAHADYAETSEFIDLLKPPHVILVHGDAVEGVGRLKEALTRRYRDSMNILAPRNCQTVELEFRAQKIAKTLGKLAASSLHSNEAGSLIPTDGALMSGLIIRRDFNYEFIDTEELATFTNLTPTIIKQEINIPWNQTFESLLFFLQQMYQLEEKNQQENKIIIHHELTLSYTSNNIILQWNSNPINDMLADSIIALLVNIQSNPHAAKLIGNNKCSHATHFNSKAHIHAKQENNTNNVKIKVKLDEYKEEFSMRESLLYGAQEKLEPNMTDEIIKPSAPPADNNNNYNIDLLWFLKQHFCSVDYNEQAKLISLHSSHSHTSSPLAIIDAATLKVIDLVDEELSVKLTNIISTAQSALEPIAAAAASNQR
jgi:hypothetical protein